MRTILLSELARRDPRPRGAWLVLEPGPYRLAHPQQPTTLPPRPSSLPGGLIEPCAFSLRLPARQAHLVLGRAPDCDLVIEEAALSLTHLVLLHGPRGWMVQDAASTNGTRLDGQPLIQARAYPLCDGARLEAGLARLTFHEAAGMARRLSRLARRSA